MYHKKAHVHFVGIGGIGMSGIATILKYQGYTISGCDTDINQQSVQDLQALGCHVYKGNNTKQCKDDSIDILVYSSIMKQDNPEIITAQKRGIPTISRALMLAELMRTKYSIAISGAHGKTTTTSLVSHILIEAKKDPTVVIGGHLKNISANARFGAGDFLVAEADESDRSLLCLQATLAVITNIDLEHLETYQDLDDIKNTFKQFLNNLPFYGKAFICIDDQNIQSLLPMQHIKMIKYGLDKNRADIYADSIKLLPARSEFNVFLKNQEQPLGTVNFAMPGKHNLLNALAAIAVARDLQIPFETIAAALENFGGIDRRFTFKGNFLGAEVFDDYGHHPEEIKNTFIVAQARKKNKLIVVFQPHRFTRTERLWDRFVDVFTNSAIDHLIITDIYGHSEPPIQEITSQNLIKAIQQKNPTIKASYVPCDESFENIKNALSSVVSENDLVLFQGAGKINKLARTLCMNSFDVENKLTVTL